MRRLVIALLVLVGLLIAVDFGAAALAESAVSRQMRDEIGLADDPSVRINGFPFLTQALAGQYSSIDVDAARISVGPLREVELSAELMDVTAPLSVLLGSGPKTVRVQQAEGTVRVGPGDLERLVPGVERVRIETIDAKALQRAVTDGADPSLAELDPDRSARIVATPTVLGLEIEVAVVAVLELADSRARIVPRDVRLADGTGLPVPPDVQRSLLQLFAIPVGAGTLPLQVTPTTFRANEGALEISGTAADLVLGATTTP